MLRRARLCARTWFLALLFVSAPAAADPPGPPGRFEAEQYADRSELVARSVSGEFSLRAEAGAGVMLSDYQRERLGYDKLAQATARLGLTLSPALSAQLSAGSFFFPADQGNGQMFAVLEGLRLDVPIGGFGRWFLDGNFGLAETVRHARVAIDAGTGIELPLFAYFELGPFVRYGHVFAATPDYPSDARFISFGLSASLRRLGVARPVPRALSDSDGDGVRDELDLCPRIASEPDPDPRRAGCPRGPAAPPSAGGHP